jgi:hypothetical protein
MKKIPFIQVLTQFYKPEVMKYVGTHWRGSGLLLLFSLSLYASVFIGYSWAKFIENTYKEVYQPTIPMLPEMTYSDNHFTFKDTEMPHTVKHPLTQKPIFYIDTRDNEVADIAAKYPCIISKDGIFITNLHIPLIPEHFDLYNVFIKPVKLNQQQSSFELFTAQMGGMASHVNDTIDFSGEDIKNYLNVSVKQTYYFTFIISTIATFISEALKILIIAIIILLMVRKGRKIKNFKQLMRLCILTYIPTFAVYAIYKFFMSQPGLLVTVLLSVSHIILFMRAVAINLDGEQKPPVL